MIESQFNRRILAALLVCCLVLTACPISAGARLSYASEADVFIAAEEEPAEVDTEEETDPEPDEALEIETEEENVDPDQQDEEVPAAANDDPSDLFQPMTGELDTLLAPVVYLNGAAGNDNYDGTFESPVKSFEKAKSLLAADGIIYITGQVGIAADQTWTMTEKGNARIVRHESYLGDMIAFTSTNKSLTLSGVTLDGGRVENVTGSIINASKNGTTLILEAGTVLMNNVTTANGAAVAATTGSASAPVNITLRDRGTKISNNESLGQLNASGIGTSGYGGGIYTGNRYITVTITEGAAISGNTALYGGGIYATGAVLLSEGAAVQENLANYVNPNGKDSGSTSIQGGGGIYLASSTGSLDVAGRDTVISGNESYDAGGGIYAKGLVSIRNGARIEENLCVSFGGGAYFYYSSGTMNVEGSGSGFYANSCLPTDGVRGGGGGIYAVGNLQLRDGAVLVGNHAAANGGGLYYSGANANLTVAGPDTRILANTCEGDGGGLYINAVKGADLGPGVMFHRNLADGNGGALGITAANRSKLTLADDTEFFANRAAFGTVEAAGSYTTAAVTAPFYNVYNNYDLLNTTGTQVQVVTFYRNDGTESVYTAVYDGAAKPEAPIRSGYTLTGWYREPECLNQYEEWDAVVNRYLDLYAGWEEGRGNISVRYHRNDGSGEVNTEEMAPGDLVKESVVPQREGYRFAGWYTSADTEFVFNTVLTEDLDLYAQWVKVYTVTFYYNYLSGSSDIFKRQTVDAGAFADEPTEPKRDGYDFTGWYTEPDADGSTFVFGTPITSDLPLYAGWQVSQDFSVVYLSGAGRDDNPGTSPEAPFKTFAQALVAVEEGGTIFITGQLTIADKQTWDAGEKQAQVQRYPDYLGYLVQVNNGGHLTLANITVDGNRDEVDDRQSINALIRVYNGGHLTLQREAVLQNNVTTVGYSGGAINVITDYQGTVTSQLHLEPGAVLRNNHFAGNSEGAGAIYAGSAELTIAGATLTDNYTVINGGAIFMKTDTTLTVTGTAVEPTVFSGNEALKDGGAIYVENSRLKVCDQVVITDNHAGQDGGAIALPTNGQAELIGGGVWLSANTAGQNGGAIYMAHCPLLIAEGVQITANEAGSNGGGIYVFGGFTTIRGQETIVAENRAAGSGGGLYASDYYTEGGAPNANILITDGAQMHHNEAMDGGGIFARRDARVLITAGAKVRDNEAQRDGGGVLATEAAILEVTSAAAVVDNQAIRYGGGIFAERQSTVEIVDGAVDRNRALSGGGLYITGETDRETDIVTLRSAAGQTSVAGNQATEKGGGLYVHAGQALLSGDEVTVTGNAAQLGGGVYVGTTLAQTSDGEISRDAAGFATVIARGSLILTNGAVVNSNVAGVFTQNAAAGSTLENGSGLGNGGGLYLEEEAYVELIQNSSISYNRAGHNGGGIYAEKNSRGTISTGGSSIGNSAYQHGGAAYSEGNLVIREGITISGNSAGAVFFNRDSASVADVSTETTIPAPTDNGLGNGGGIYIESGILAVLPGGVFTGNMADYGGGIYIGEAAQYVYVTGDEPDVAMLAALGIKENEYDKSYHGFAMKDNVVRYDGGGIYTHRLDILTAENITFQDNLARITVSGKTLEDLELVIRLLHEANIINIGSYSADYQFAYNNLDINFQDDLPFWSVVLFMRNDGTDDIYHAELFRTAGETPVAGPRLEPTRPDYEFTGWYTTPKGSEAYAFQEHFTQSGTIVHVYAGWDGEDGEEPENPEESENLIKRRTTKVETVDLTDNHFAYLVGYPDVTVRPEASITRAEVGTVFFRLLTDEARAKYWSRENVYHDVQRAGWYNNAVSTMAQGGYLTGYEDGSFRPDEAITRAEMTAIAVRFLASDDLVGEDDFWDVDGHWAEESIRLAAAAGWVAGYEDGSFQPDDPITRAEVSILMNNVLNRVLESDEDLLADMKDWPDNQPGAWHYLDLQEATHSHYYETKAETGAIRWTTYRDDPDWFSLEGGDYIPVNNYQN